MECKKGDIEMTKEEGEWEREVKRKEGTGESKNAQREL